MDRNEILQEIKSYQHQFNELGINSFQHRYEAMNILNPYFGYKKMTNYEHNSGWGVNSLWMAIDDDRMIVKAHPRGYGGNEVKFETHNMSLRQLEGICELLKTLTEERLKDIQRTQSNPKLETLLPEIKEWAERCVKIAGKDLSVELGYGRRTCDGPYSYHALVVYDRGDQVGSIPLRQDKNGKLTYNTQRPLCGESGYEEFTPVDWKDKIKAALEEISRCRINMDREDSPVRNPEVIVNYNRQYAITCEIDGQRQMRKYLNDNDRMDYLRCEDVAGGFYLQERRYELAEKYFKHEIEIACDCVQTKGMGR